LKGIGAFQEAESVASERKQLILEMAEEVKNEALLPPQQVRNM
jgi:hypothetical protein